MLARFDSFDTLAAFPGKNKDLKPVQNFFIEYKFYPLEIIKGSPVDSVYFLWSWEPLLEKYIDISKSYLPLKKGDTAILYGNKITSDSIFLVMSHFLEMDNWRNYFENGEFLYTYEGMDFDLETFRRVSSSSQLEEKYSESIDRGTIIHGTDGRLYTMLGYMHNELIYVDSLRESCTVSSDEYIDMLRALSLKSRNI
jgi:hypothetical protein